MLAMNVGNTRTQVGRFIDGELKDVSSHSNEDLGGIVDQAVTWWTYFPEGEPRTVLLASVNDTVADRLASTLADQLSEEVYRIGDDLPIPIAEDLDPETVTGVDRLLNAAAAWNSLQEACIVVDAGTAVTVDFIDGVGTFHGGAIAPGARMQLKALHEGTDTLPEIEFTAPAAEAIGKSTSEAMLQGVYQGIRGMVWRLVEQYAQQYGAYPMVVATGGDAEELFADDELINRIIPNLTLLGIVAAARRVLAAEEDGVEG